MLGEACSITARASKNEPFLRRWALHLAGIRMLGKGWSIMVGMRNNNDDNELELSTGGGSVITGSGSCVR